MDEATWLASSNLQAMLEWVRDPAHAGIAGQPYLSARKLRLFACACCRAVWPLLTDDAPCGRCGGDGKFRAPENIELVRWDGTYKFGSSSCPDCDGTGRVNRSRRAVEVAERYADGLATEEELAEAWHVGGLGWSIESVCAQSATEADWPARRIVGGEVVGPCPSPAAQAALLRCLVGNPFRPVRRIVRGGVLWWVADARVQALARSIYDESRWGDLGVLADALEEAGCPAEVECGRCGGHGWTGKISITGGKDRTRPCDCRRAANGDRVRPHPLLEHLRGPGPHARGCWCVDLLLGKE